jgi:hypothetical protein
MWEAFLALYLTFKRFKATSFVFDENRVESPLATVANRRIAARGLRLP